MEDPALIARARRYVCHHEGSHIVVAKIFGVDCSYTRICDPDTGYAVIDAGEAPIAARIMIAMAGELGEHLLASELLDPAPFFDPASYRKDRARVAGLAALNRFSDGRVQALRDQTLNLLRQRWPCVQAVARVLNRRNFLSGTIIDRVHARAIGRLNGGELA